MAAKKTAKNRRPTKKAPPRARSAARKPGNGRDVLALRTASPSFTVNDLEKSLGWYRDVLGFDVEETWKNPDGKVMGISLKAGDVSFMIGQDDWKKGRDRSKGEGFRIYCETKKSVDDLARRIEAKGGRLDSGPTDQPWGVRDISVTDPDGFKITIARATR
ncbi:MAG TPA: VOC family protein [Thermoanaerobaculia bacterium]|nr:VOC family protein [Thermoanaerobaculia bacterium]